ncbi:hypothetical protein GCM10028803_14950 [Larkinella knui]|uniref:Transglutaminase-like domain-containing protein n=1 Tax=Larkinella knui TaxID=2025310 RepID=A0A3P1C995_9BACT|nr:transglutaminase domain-containing protein [Larkinella knui]RRB09868.1 hypothetical protein EHT87_30580 [Larkinella knui]
MKRLLAIPVLLSGFFLFSCTTDNEKKEKLLNAILTHYQAPADSLQRRAAAFLVGHMDGLSTGESETEDLGKVDADYLINNIDLAFKAAADQLKEGSLTFTDFCEYVLPYRLANEPLTPWREQCIKEFSTLRDTFRQAEDPNMAICKKINIDFFNQFKYSMKAQPAKYLSWGQLAKNKEGDCWTMTSTISYPLRALGVAVTTDFAPMWGNSNGGPHAWNAMVTSKHDWAKFMGCERYPAFPADFDPLGIYHEQRRPAKVFRKTYSINKATLPHLLNDEDDIPYNLLFDRVIDVTDLYVPTSTIDINLTGASEVEMAYLATFSNGEWIPVYWSKPVNNHCRFQKMATGLVYLPCTYEGGKGVTALDSPFYIDEATGEKVVCQPDSKQKTAVPVQLTRSKITEEGAVYSLGLSGIALFQTMDSVCLGLKRSEPIADKTYRLFYWQNGWQMTGEQKKLANRPLQFENIPAGALYRLLPDDPKNTERIFTVANNRQLWW